MGPWSEKVTAGGKEDESDLFLGMGRLYQQCTPQKKTGARQVFLLVLSGYGWYYWYFLFIFSVVPSFSISRSMALSLFTVDSVTLRLHARYSEVF